MEAWFLSRGISQATLEQARVKYGTVFKGSPAIYFGYRSGWKARTFPEKKFICGGGFKAEFWGIEDTLEAKPSMVFFVEGELDRLALIEAGIPACQVLSVPTGAAGEGGTLEYLHAALREGLDKVKRFVWCGDADQPGKALRDGFIRVLGAARFWHVEWPEGVKDANAMLLSDGAEAVHELITKGALPWPQGGLYRLSELATPPPLQVWETSIPDFRDKVMLAPRTLSLVTGQPGHGKTLLFQQIWYDVVSKYNLICCMASFETRPKPHIRRQLRTLISGKLEWDMTDFEKAQADAWIEERYLFVLHNEQRPTLEWFLECAETAVIRHGAKIVQIDPWNRLEVMRAPRESETEYVLRCLRALYVFAQDMDCHVQVVAHPAKMDGGRRNTPPTLEDISGCYSDDTEVLTKRGWLKHKEVTLRDDVACFDLEHATLKWAKPSKIWKYEYTGDMHHHRYRGGDLLVTPTHRMVVMPCWGEPKTYTPRTKYHHSKWQFLESSNLIGGKWFVPQSGYWEPQSFNEDIVIPSSDKKAFWSFVGWWIAEGHVSMGGLSICQREDNSHRIIKLLEIMGLDYSSLISYPKLGAKGTLPIWTARIKKRSHPELCEWIIARCRGGAAVKRIPLEVFLLPIEYQLAVFDGLMAGDGHAHKAGWSYSTISSQLADDVQRLAIQLGYTAQLRILPKPANPKHRMRYQVNINGRSRSSLHPYRNTKVVPYRGTVWCLTIPTGAYITRRNGWASICGNSKHWENIVDQGFTVHRPEMYDGTERKTITAFYHRKARFEELGFPCKIFLNYDLNQRKYVPLSEGLVAQS